MAPFGPARLPHHIALPLAHHHASVRSSTAARRSSSTKFACERDRLLLRSLARRHRDDREFILADEDIERFGHPSPKGGLAESVDRLDMTTKTLERLLQAIAGQVDRSLAIVADRRPAQHQGSRSAIGKSSEEHTSELQSLIRISYAVFCLQKKNNT